LGLSLGLDALGDDLQFERLRERDEITTARRVAFAVCGKLADYWRFAFGPQRK
jgi:hypothetical protein